MIESLNGIFETINYKQSTSIKLYDNYEYEDYPAHWHTNLEIIMPTENIYTVEYYNQIITLREGDIVLICPGCIHTLYAPEKGRRIIFQADINPLRFMKEIETLVTIISPLIVITPEDFPSIYDKVKSLLLEIKNEYLSSSTSFSEVSIYSKTLEIITLIGRSRAAAGMETPSPDAPRKQEEYIEKFIEICNYISAHCSNELNLEAVASMSGFSKFYFSRLFKQFTNTFYKYVNQKRIEKAAEMLTEPNISITNVALSCGFESLSSFIRMFKIVKGCTPTEFRNMYQYC